MRRVKRFILNATLLTSVTLILRTVGIGFNVYLSNKIGAQGMGLYTLSMSVYSLAVTFAVSGIGLASTRLTAEMLASGDNASARNAMKKCLLHSIAFGAVAFVLLFCFSDFIGNTLLSDERTVLSLKVMAFGMPFVSMSSALNGYFQAVRRVHKNAIIQIGEQFMRISVTAYLLNILMPAGIEYSCLALVIGSSFSELLSFVFSYTLYRIDLSKHIKNQGSCGKGIMKRIVSISFPVALSTYVRSALVTVEHILIPKGLRKSGSAYDTALASYGVIHGMVFPVLLFPQALLSALAGLLIPETAESIARGENARIKYITERVFQATLAFSIGVSGIMICFSYELGMMIYSNREASFYIRMFAPLIPLMYIDHITDGILKGLNQQIYSMRVNIADSFLSVILVYFLIPHLGVTGYVITIFVSEMLNTGLSICRLISVSDARVRVLKWFAKPLICIVGATCTEKLILTAVQYFYPFEANAVLEIIVSSLIYFVYLRLTGSVSRDDIIWIKSIIK